MANKSVYVDQKSMLSVLNKLKAVGGLEKEFQDEINLMVKRSAAEASARFNTGALPLLKRRGEKTRGLSNSIRAKVISRKKNDAAYSITAGGVGKELMAYAEFGTRSKRIDLRGVKALFGKDGSDYAKQFKGGDNKKNFTHLEARPYFFSSIMNQKRKFYLRMNALIKSKIKK